MKKHLKMHEKQNKNDENDFLQAFSHQVTFEVKENKHVCEFCGRYVFFREIALKLLNSVKDTKHQLGGCFLISKNSHIYVEKPL